MYYWEQTLELKAAHDKARKERSMIFQVNAKEEAAQAFKRPLNYFYYLPYVKWARISRAFTRKQNQVMTECRKLGIPGNMPWSQHPHYRERMGL